MPRASRRSRVHPFLIAAVTALAGALLLMSAGRAEGATQLGVDVLTDGNAAAQLGGIDYCRRVEVGAAFDVDIFIKDVQGLRGWELYLGFDPALLTLQAQDSGFFLGAGLFDGSDPVPDSGGVHFLGVGSLAPASGSGVLARLTLWPKVNGLSPVSILSSPSGPRLNPGSDPLGDTTGDGVFDGPVSSGQIAIGQDCGPTPTPAGPLRGDTDCDGEIGSVDALNVLRFVAGFSDDHGGCPLLGSAYGGGIFGDVDCSLAVESTDALALLRHVALLPVALPPGCPAIGSG